MNILYIAHRIPYPPNKGDKVRSFHQIQHLAKKHSVHLACLVDDPEDLRHVKALGEYCTSVLAVYRGKTTAKLRALMALSTRKPLSVASFYSRVLQRRIAQKLHMEEFDRIFVFSSAMAEYVRHIVGIPKIIDFVDADSEKWRLYADYHPFPLSWLYRLEAVRLVRYEVEVAKTFEHSIFISEAEAYVLHSQSEGCSISVIPNGIDTDYFSSHRECQPVTDQPSIVFTGAMDYFPNIDAVRYFCQVIFPLIRRTIPNIQFYIVGRHPTRQVRALSDPPHVTVTGSVPDVRPYLAAATLAVAPLRIARGVQNKILEAMAMGLPVVGTSTAFRGLQASPSDGVRIADEPGEFAREVFELLQDHALRQRCSCQARQFVNCYYRWQDHGSRLESLLHELG